MSFGLIVVSAFLLALISYVTYEWLEKNNLEKEYLQGLLKNQEKDNNIIRKG